MLNIGTPELLVVLLVGLIVLGPTKLPHVARQIGKAITEIRRMGAGFQAEMRDALQEPVASPPSPSVPTATPPSGGTEAVQPVEADVPEGEAPAGDGDATAG